MSGIAVGWLLDIVVDNVLEDIVEVVVGVLLRGEPDMACAVEGETRLNGEALRAR